MSQTEQSQAIPLALRAPATPGLLELLHIGASRIEYLMHMSGSDGSRPFQVDLRGVVDLLGRHIYSSPRVYLRELLQNGVDAITARTLVGNGEGDSAWGITIRPATDVTPFCLIDDGIGLAADEVTDLLATVGRSSKRDILDLARTDYLGQFGIGLLSCFMVSDEIRILTRSATGAGPVEWIGSGDGTFTVRPYAGALPVGTRVFLSPRFDTRDLLAGAVPQLAREYGQYLAVPIDLVEATGTGGATGDGGPLVPPLTREDADCGPRPRGTRINVPPVFADDAADGASLAAFARDELGFTPLEVINLSAPGTGTVGKGFVLPFSPPPNAHQATGVYLGGMLLSKRVDELLPDWAFFVRAVVSSTGLTPTASREGLVEDFNLEYTRDQLGACVRTWLANLALHSPARFGAFLAVHEVAIKQLVLHDEDMAHIFMGWLSVETSAGRLRLDRLVKLTPLVRYARTLDEFRQVASLSREDSPLVNGGYVYDSELVELLPTVYPAVEVTRVDVLAELDRLDPPALSDRTLTVQLEDRATAALESRECQAVVRIMEKTDVPALFVSDPEVFRHIDRGRAGEAAGGLWAEILAQTDAFAVTLGPRAQAGFSARLCLNWANPLVRSLATLEDRVVFERSVQLLYVQSQLAGSYPLTAADRTLMTTALSDIIQLTTHP
ncbi:MAG: HSP90 family protein [Propionibacteriaceae bacterium]|jgi:molecular chaperone HtpG|nr:HSP90 family protein [Propionibacteriaceae bacterium]